MIWISWNQLKRNRHCFTQPPPRPRPAAPEGNRSLLFGGFPHFRGHRQVATLATEGDLPMCFHRFPVSITENWEWKIYESYGNIWKHMETYGNIVVENLWNHYETYGNEPENFGKWKTDGASCSQARAKRLMRAARSVDHRSFKTSPKSHWA